MPKPSLIPPSTGQMDGMRPRARHATAENFTQRLCMEKRLTYEREREVRETMKAYKRSSLFIGVCSLGAPSARRTWGVGARMNAKGTVCRKKATSADYWFTGFLVARPFLKVLPR